MVRKHSHIHATTTPSLATRFTHHLRSGLAAYWASFFALMAIEFFLGGQLSKILSKENYSLYVTVLNNLPFYNILLNAGLSYGLVYIASYSPGSRYGLFREALDTQTIWYFILVGLHFAVFLVFGGVWLQALLITSAIAYTYAYKLNLTSFFLAEGSYRKAAVSNSLQKCALLLVFVSIPYIPGMQQMLNDRFVTIYPAMELGVLALYFVFFAKTNATTFSTPRPGYRKRLLKYGKYALLNNSLNVLCYSLLALIIRCSRLEIHQQIMLGLCILFFRYTGAAVAPVFSTMNPQLTKRRNNAAEIKNTYRKYGVFVSITSMAALLGCRLFFGFFITHFYAARYHDLPVYFNFFCYLIPLLFFNSFHASVMAALGRIKFTAAAEVVSTLALLLCFVYYLVYPPGAYTFIYYVVLIYLLMKFAMLSYGIYKTIKNAGQ